MQSTTALVIISCLASLLNSVDALRFTSIQMPALVQRGTNFWLACQYELTAPGGRRSTADDSLYSVKWYKNNEEFYRVLFNAAGQSMGPTENNGGNSFQGGEQQSGPQYFPQAGVNVLMSSSNATHVRLLNASLDSEGAYACEISTENLSTIRHEREIKVYVLPQSKLSVIGLRNAYTLNERVELHCLADASRPAGALGWFINGRRITTNSRHFELREAQPSWLSNGAGEQLARVSLGLKFRLTSEILRRMPSGDNQGARRNQSQASDQLAVALPLLRLECKFRLADVSDVTFTELNVARATALDLDVDSGYATPAPEAPHYQRRRRRRRRREHAHRQHQQRRAKRYHSAPGSIVQRSAPSKASQFSLVKGHGSRVVQSSCPAQLKHLLDLLSSHESLVGAQACQLGPIALQVDDPVILEADSGEDGESATEPDNEQTEIQHPNNGLKLPEGALLTVNCSTLGALLALRAHDNGRAIAWPLVPSRRSAAHHEVALRQQPPMDFCVDPMARRRTLISGKHQAVASGQANYERQSGAHTGQRSRNQIAHVKLTGGDASAADYDDRLGGRSRGESQLFGDNLGAELAQTSASVGVTKSLAQLDSQQQRQAQQLTSEQQLLAPPLLEWFINNQEAPKSSASYEPELPLTLARTSGDSLEKRPPGGVTRGSNLRGANDSTPSQLPSIDYAQYFANFDGRPLGQHLKLSLKLDKKHFMAHLLMTDSVTVSFVVAPSDGQVAGGSGWRQWPAGSAATNQMKQKYLHQYARSSSQKFASPPGHVESRAQYASSGAGLASSNSGLGSMNRAPQLVIALCTLIEALLQARRMHSRAR